MFTLDIHAVAAQNWNAKEGVIAPVWQFKLSCYFYINISSDQQKTYVQFHLLATKYLLSKSFFIDFTTALTPQTKFCPFGKMKQKGIVLTLKTYDFFFFGQNGNQYTLCYQYLFFVVFSVFKIGYHLACNWYKIIYPAF